LFGKVEEDELGGNMGGKINAYRIVARKSKGKRPLGRLGYRWEGNFRMDLRNRMGRCGQYACGPG
jgi:hypothetical protein